VRWCGLQWAIAALALLGADSRRQSNLEVSMLSRKTLATLCTATGLFVGSAAMAQTADQPVTPEQNRTSNTSGNGANAAGDRSTTPKPDQPVTPEQNRTQPGASGTGTTNLPGNDATDRLNNGANRMGMRDTSSADLILQQQFEEISKSGASAPDKLFTLNAACGNMWETELSRVVAQRAQDAQVKDLATQMINDHTTANRNLSTAAQAQGVTLPTSLPSNKQAELSVYRSMPVDKMEKCYIGMLKADHAKDVTEYAIHQKDAENAQLKQYIDQTLPKLREHAQHVNTVASAKGITADTTVTDTSREMK